jgi:hypothetical protein
MTSDDIIRIGRDSGVIQGWMVLRDEEVHALSRFAALVAAAEREACALVCKDTFYSVQAADAIRARGQQ